MQYVHLPFTAANSFDKPQMPLPWLQRCEQSETYSKGPQFAGRGMRVFREQRWLKVLRPGLAVTTRLCSRG